MLCAHFKCHTFQLQNTHRDDFIIVIKFLKSDLMSTINMGNSGQTDRGGLYGDTGNLSPG